MRKRLKILIFLLFFAIPLSLGKHVYKEAHYQQVWCSNNKGIPEYKNADKTRVDCLTKTHAVEFDFAPKWAESVGQALYYSMVTGKRGMVVLILENPQKECVYLERVKFMAKRLNFDVDFMTLDSLTKCKEQN